MIRTLSLALLLFAAPVAAAQDAPKPLCTGLGAVALQAGETVETSQGPDFSVEYVSGPAGKFGIYIGNYAQVSNGKRSLAFTRGSLKIERVVMEGRFSGYLVENDSGLQNHFFGDIFKGDDSDEAFFSRVTFGKCPG